ncbi:MAG: hypothetical protein LBT59_18600 [Clostridiales bacterium]|jgi:hypothetical protein|nr:hypothetical protein [Clostridiales bacterium]
MDKVRKNSEYPRINKGHLTDEAQHKKDFEYLINKEISAHRRSLAYFQKSILDVLEVDGFMLSRAFDDLFSESGIKVLNLLYTQNLLTLSDVADLRRRSAKLTDHDILVCIDGEMTESIKELLGRLLKHTDALARALEDLDELKKKSLS